MDFCTSCAHQVCEVVSYSNEATWSMEGSGSSELWDSNSVKNLFEIEGAECDQKFGEITITMDEVVSGGTEISQGCA